jgi:hypothetical protein
MRYIFMILQSHQQALGKLFAMIMIYSSIKKNKVDV